MRSSPQSPVTPASAISQAHEFTDADFECIRQLVSQHTGISLAAHKRCLIYGRLRKRLQALGIRQFRDYCELIRSGNNSEIEQFINSITTNLTYFYREEHHFDYLANDLLPTLVKNDRTQRRIRIMSAGCSTGEEPYSLAMTLCEVIEDIENYDVRILATDLDSNVLRTAAKGVYSIEDVEGLDKQRIHSWFLRGRRGQHGKIRVSPALRKLITFKQLNLMQPWPMQGPFDIIFCRNVVIYFDKPTQRTLFERFANLMQPGAHLFIGHSESLQNITDRFKLIGNSIYQRV
ncbi:MAG: protein-glutamate O-methyltransferase CheR [Gammaproteobacteria bacterium]|nr:protein-glutamate O-methyltransferase CheR [Gammaproteobacteria bacterium]NNJ95858.1 protein-glutamate O-methyltransferase CheR [Gammaproteobacteria bacterium]